MRRLLLLTVLLAVLPVQAQRLGMSAPAIGFGGRHFGGGHFGGFISGQAAFGHNPRFHVFFGPPFFPRHRFFRRHIFVNPGFSDPFFSQNRFLPLNSGVVAVPTTVVGAPVALGDRSQDEVSGLESEVLDLREEVQQLRREEQELRESREQGEATQARPAPTASGSSGFRPSVQEIAPSTILIFRDGRRLEVRNYAVVGKTLWILDEQQARKFPLSALDLPASKRANEARGGEFLLPGLR